MQSLIEYIKETFESVELMGEWEHVVLFQTTSRPDRVLAMINEHHGNIGVDQGASKLLIPLDDMKSLVVCCGRIPQRMITVIFVTEQSAQTDEDRRRLADPLEQVG